MKKNHRIWKILRIILLVSIPIHLLLQLGIQVTVHFFPTLIKGSVLRYVTMMNELEFSDWKIFIAITGMQLLFLIVLYRSKFFRITWLVLSLVSVIVFTYASYFLKVPELAVSSERIANRIFLTWEPEADSTYTVEKGIDQYDLKTVSQDNPLGLYADEDNHQVVYYRVTEFLAGKKESVSPVIRLDITVDTDEDGLIDDRENTHGTDPHNSDTDGDGLSDFEEIEIHKTDPLKNDTDEDTLSDFQDIYLGLNPLKPDTDNDYISDDQEDLDGDNLSNSEEFQFNTDGILVDTDFDGLSDGDERYYDTNPNKIDTDGDGVSDGDEIESRTNPLKKDSDGDGIPDGKEKITIVVTIPEALTDERIIPSIEIPITAENQNDVTIYRLDDDEIFNREEIPGYIGNAYEIFSPDEIVDGKITMSIQSELIDSVDSPTIYRIDEETLELEELSGQERDGNLITAPLTTSGKYIVLNKKLFEEVWELDLSDEAQNRPFVFVIDNSESMDDNDSNNIRFNLSERFIDNIQATNGQIGIVTFNKKADTVSALTTNFDGLKQGISTIKNSGSTNGRAGIHKAIQELKSAGQSKKKTIVFLTDGADTDSYDLTYDQLVEEAKANNITIYSIGLGSVRPKNMENIALQTNGKYYYAEEIASLDDIYHSISNQSTKKQPELINKNIPNFLESLEAEPEVTDKQLSFLSDLAYLDNTQGKTVEELEEIREEIYKGEQHKLRAYQSQKGQLAGWKVIDIYSVGNFSMTVFNKKSTFVLAYRGTDDDFDWGDHGALFFSKVESWSRFKFFDEESSHPQDEIARRIAERLFNELGIRGNESQKVYITGHSLGGRTALISNDYFQKRESFSNRIEKVVTFNGLGVFDIYNDKAYAGNNINYIVDGELLSFVLFGPDKNKKILQVSDSFTRKDKHNLYHFWEHPGVQGK